MKTTNQICKKIHISKLSTYTRQKHLDLQACKKLAHGGVKAFDDYMCTSVNMKKCISYKVNENNKICYTVQHIKVQDVYIFTMLCTFYVFTSWSNMLK